MKIKYCPICKDYTQMRDEGVQLDADKKPAYRQFGCTACKGSFSNISIVEADPGRGLIRRLIEGTYSKKDEVSK